MCSARAVVPVVCVFLMAALFLPLAAAQSKTKARRRSSGASNRVSAPSSAWPTFQARHSEWVRSRELAASQGAPDPNPLGQYLVSEIIVTGLFETETGAGAFLYAKPTGNVFFAEAGTTLYNGRLIEIRVPTGGFVVEDSEVVFAERTSRKTGEERRVSRKVESAPVPEAPGPSPGQEANPTKDGGEKPPSS